jgi:hypothetical protein
MKLLYQYTNGNTNVSIYDDGTKVREYDGVPQPVHPESMDVKITNMCDGACLWCHEKSLPDGDHADLNALLKKIQGLPAGAEIAIGGGNPLMHPDLVPFLVALSKQGLVANMTINQKHLEKSQDQLSSLIKEKLIYGVGISYSDPKYLPFVAPLMALTDNIVFHVIMGVNPVEVVEELNSFCGEQEKPCKILILGYKDYGFGSRYLFLQNEKVEQNKLRWYRYLAQYFNENNLTISFDNLAITQLNLKRFFTEKAWEKFYMGDDGIFTMYIDAVKQEFAMSSTSSKRTSFEDSSLLNFFQNLRKHD